MLECWHKFLKLTHILHVYGEKFRQKVDFSHRDVHDHVRIQVSFQHFSHKYEQFNVRILCQNL